MNDQKILFVCNAVKWFDRTYGNTYHSIRITRISDNKTICQSMTYGYSDHYKQTTLELMFDNKWLKNFKRKDEKHKFENYDKKSLYLFERENNYPILWNISNGLKRDMIANGKI